MAAARPTTGPKASKVPDVSVRGDVSSMHIDDPTAAFPIGALAGLDEEESSEQKASPTTGDGRGGSGSPRSASFRPVVAGVDLRWFVASLAAGAALALFVVVVFGMVVLLVRN
jgi:hypothetical protein